MAISPNQRGLYPALIGSPWESLAEPVRRFFDGGASARWRGCVRIERADNWRARLAARCLRLPGPGQGVAAELVIIPECGRETWRRRLGEEMVVTTQSAGRDGHLTEAFGPVEFDFHLATEDGALRFQQMSARLRIARVRLPIPRWLCPTVSALCQPAGVSGCIHASVRIRMPLIGVLLAYEGQFEREGEAE